MSTSIVETIRNLAACLAPISGTRATLRVLVKATGADVVLPCGLSLVPAIGGETRDVLVFRVADGPHRAHYQDGVRLKVAGEPPEATWWTVTKDGTTVDLYSLTGGIYYNSVKAGTVLVFDPPLVGVEAEVIAVGDASGATDSTIFGGCKCVTTYEQLPDEPSLELFASGLFALPGVVIVWNDSTPSDGGSSSTVVRGARAGGTTQFYKEGFTIFVISKRVDTARQRTGEAFRLLELVSGLLNNRKSVDGAPFSSPGGVFIRNRARVVNQTTKYKQFTVFTLQVSVNVAMVGTDDRIWNEWLKTSATTLTHDVDAQGQKLTTSTTTFGMTHDGE